MRLVTLNIRHGGGTRVGLVAAYIADRAADAVVVTEFRRGPRGDALIEALAGAGYRDHHRTRAEPGANSVLVATKARSRRIRLEVSPADRDRIVCIELDGLRIVGVYFNLLRAKASLFDFLLSRPPALGADCVVLGDLNTGAHHLDEAGATFHCADRFSRLTERGYTDLWRLKHGSEARAWSWYSPGRRNGFRIDHAFGAGRVPGRVRSCEYDAATLDGLSDHAVLAVDLAA